MLRFHSQPWSRLLLDYLLRKGRGAVALVMVSGGVALLSGDQLWDLLAAILTAFWPALEISLSETTFSTAYRLGVGGPLVIGGVLLVLVRFPSNLRGPLQARDTLRLVWKDANHIDCDQLITPDVLRAVEALETTATIWEFEPLNRPLITRYKDSFMTLVKELLSCNAVPPGLETRCDQMVAQRVLKVLEELEGDTAEAISLTNSNGRNRHEAGTNGALETVPE